MLRGATCSPISKAITIGGASTPPSATSPHSRQRRNTRNPVSTFPGEGQYRDPIAARVTSRCDWRIGDLVEADHPVSLYLVVPPSDISRTKPLVRLILNQIGRRQTESLEGVERRHQLLLMLDEFAALGRLDFFETALAFQAGYGIRAFLIAQSLNQIQKAYGEHDAILDN